MRRNTVKEKGLPVENLAVYQLIKAKTNGVMKDFAEKLGVTSQTIQRLFKIDNRYYDGTGSPRYPRVSPALRDKIASVYGLPDDWLEQASSRIESERFEAGFKPGVKRYPMIMEGAQAGSLSDMIEDGVEMMDEIPYMPKYDCTIRVSGDSMRPTYYSGDVLAVRNIDDTGFIQWGCVHVVDSKQGIIVKRIYEDKDGIKCVPDNENYMPFILSKDDILHIYKIVGFLRVGDTAIQK